MLIWFKLGINRIAGIGLENCFKQISRMFFRLMFNRVYRFHCPSNALLALRFIPLCRNAKSRSEPLRDLGSSRSAKLMGDEQVVAHVAIN